MLDTVAEFERALTLERQREGIAKAKGESRYKGRAPTARQQAAEMARLKTCIQLNLLRVSASAERVFIGHWLDPATRPICPGAGHRGND